MLRLIIVILIISGIDWYVFRTFQNQFSGFQGAVKIPVYSAYWLIPIVLLASVLYLVLSNVPGQSRHNGFVAFMAAFLVLFYLPKLFVIVFQFIEDFSKIIAWIVKRVSMPESFFHSGADRILKSVIVGRIGLFISLIPFISVLYGVVYGRFNFTVNEQVLSFKHLPKQFDGFKIVQFSDFHAGSLDGQQDKFKKAFDLINAQQADIIVFTGDMVNNHASEIVPWIELISDLNAKDGKFSILGNHDYGDYVQWANDSAKKQNLLQLVDYHKQMGFNVLLNDAAVIERDSAKIAILGVENWGEKPFPQHGLIDVAMEKVKDVPFKVLLSHDPTHWEQQVKGKTDVALTLSGHTHGMQMAINIAGFSWSPVSFKYPKWKGLFVENEQYLYINLGLGYIGFPGRVGTDPEITVFTLKSSIND